MAELLVIIKVLKLKISFLASTVLSDLESMFMGFIPHCIALHTNCHVFKNVYLG